MKKLTPFITAAIFTVSMSCISNVYAEWKELGYNEAMVVYVDLDTVRVSGEEVSNHVNARLQEARKKSEQ